MAEISLFERAKLGPWSLQNRIVMAPMTRHRAGPDWSPPPYSAEYYGQRGGAGMIITEATQCSAGAAGYPRTPGLWCDRHVEAWARIVEAVHAGGAVAILQAWHCGRISHPDNLPLGFEPLGPSAVRPNSYNVSDKVGGQVQMPIPRAMSESAIEQAILEFGQCARYARDAGFDGFEIHGANGYLVEQFASSNTNIRKDQWGGSVSNRLRFMVRVIEEVSKVFGISRVGIRFSPFGTFNDIHDSDPLAIYRAKLDAVTAMGIGCIHVIRPTVTGNVDQENPAPNVDVIGMARATHKGLLICAGNYDRAGAERELARGAANLIAFGRPFVANPDLVRRLNQNLPLSPLREDRLYAGGEEGYADYPAYSDS
jgi:N-ethylmaleimide reductase